MNSRLKKYLKQLRDDIIEYDSRAYEHEKAMESYIHKSSEAREILEILERREDENV